MSPGLIRYVSSAVMRMVMKKRIKISVRGNVLEPSKGNMGIDGKSLFSVSAKLLIWTAAGILGIVTVKFLFSGISKRLMKLN
jgi:hypothetical protein